MLALTELDGMYHLDPAHSSIAFVARHAGIAKVRGTFESFHGWALIDGAQPEHSALLVSVKVSSINSRDANRDGHLRSPDFFDVAQFPEITFATTSVEKTEDGVVLVGNLTIKGVTKSVSIPVSVNGPITDPWGNTRYGFEGATKVNRQDWGLTWNKTMDAGGVVVGDEVRIEISVEGIQKK